jgi:hypothetical protein
VVWGGYVLWVHRGWRPAAAGTAALAVPLVAYCTAHAAAVGTFTLAESDGWFLYGRVAEIADCSKADIPDETRVLCTPAGDAARANGPAFYVFSPESPAVKAFGGIWHEDPDRRRRVNGLLRDHALAVIRARPGRFADVVVDELWIFLSAGSERASFKLLREPRPPFGEEATPEDVEHVRVIQERYLGGYRARAAAPKELLVDYQDVLAVPPFARIGLVAASLLAVGAAMARRRIPRVREIVFLFGSAAILLIAAIVTSGIAKTVTPSGDSSLRYMMPTLPLLVAAGLLAIEDLAGLALARRRRGR